MDPAHEWAERELYSHEGILFHNEVRLDVLERVKNFKFDANDVVVATFPRSGTTWTQEMTWLVCNDADVAKAKIENLDNRTRFMEFNYKRYDKPEMDFLEKTPPPRVMKSHLPPRFFGWVGTQPKHKIIVVMRNLKDVLVSQFHFGTKLLGLPATWDQFFELFKAKTLPYGTWVDNCLAWWRLRHLDNILILKYEDMKRDHPAAVRKIAEFCGKQLTEEQITAICEHTGVDSMRDMPSMKPDNCEDFKKVFVRKGVVGDWRAYFSEEQLSYVGHLLAETVEKEGLFFNDN